MIYVCSKKEKLLGFANCKDRIPGGLIWNVLLFLTNFIPFHYVFKCNIWMKNSKTYES